MLKTLIKKQLLELFAGFVVNRKKGVARGKKGIVLYGLLMALIFAFLGFAVYQMSADMGSAMFPAGLTALYFALMGLLSIALGVFGSVFSTYAGLYQPKDNEFLLSLPIPGHKLVLARTSGVFFMSLLYSAIVWVPACAAYWVLVPANVCGVLFPALLTLVIALFVTVLSCALGWLVALIAAKAKGKSFLKVFLSLAFIAVYYLVYFRAIESLGDLLNHLDTIDSFVGNWLHYSHLLGQAAAGQTGAMLAVTILTAALGAICLLVLSKTLIRLATAEEKTQKTAIKAIGYEKKAVRKALVQREFKHFASMSAWMLNGGLGLVILLALGVAALVKKDADAIQAAITSLPADADPFLSALPIFLTALIGIVASTNMLLTCSVSLEGKNLWILQTLPLDPWEVLRAKEIMGVSLLLFPTVFAGIAIGLTFGLDAGALLLVLAALVLFVLLSQDFALTLNLMHPDLNWTNPITVIKQGAPAAIYLFGGILFCAAVGAGGFLLCRQAGIYVAMAAVIALYAALWLLLHRWLKTKGTKILKDL